MATDSNSGKPSTASTACQTPGVGPPAIADSWPDGVDGEHYNRVVRVVRDYPGGVRFRWLVETIHGRNRAYETVDGDRRPTAEYQRVRRAVHDLADRGIVRVEKRPDIWIDDGKAVENARRNADLWVYPEWIPPVLKSSRQGSPHGSAEPPNPGKAAGSLPSRAPSGRAAGVARSVFRDRCQITPGSRGAGVRAALRHALAAHREGVDTDGMRADRVSSPARAARRQAVYLSAWEAAAARHRTGVMLTVTSRPGEAGDMVDSAVAVADSIDPLRKWIGRRTPGDGAADAVVVVDVADRGMLHLHVVVFGVMPAAFDRDALGRYWNERRGHGYVVDVAPVERRGCRWVFADHATADTERGRYPKSYLGEMLYRFGDVADADPDTIHRADGREWWKVALLWATGLPLVTVSRSLRNSPASLLPRGTDPAGTRLPDAPARSLRPHRRPRRRLAPTRSTDPSIRGLDPPTDRNRDDRIAAAPFWA